MNLSEREAKILARIMDLIPNKNDGGKTFTRQETIINGEQYGDDWFFPTIGDYDSCMEILNKIASLHYRVRIDIIPGVISEIRISPQIGASLNLPYTSISYVGISGTNPVEVLQNGIKLFIGRCNFQNL